MIHVVVAWIDITIWGASLVLTVWALLRGRWCEDYFYGLVLALLMSTIGVMAETHVWIW